MQKGIPFYLSTVLVTALMVMSQPAQAQVAELDGGAVGMGHLHLLVSDANYVAHRDAWVRGLGARPETVGPLEFLLLPGVAMVLKKGEPSGGSEGSTVNHLGFHVRDLEKRVSHWKSLGYEVYQERPSPTQVFLRMPGNIKVELSEDPTMTMPVSHHHIHIFTPDVAATKNWYIETLGGRPGKRGPWEEVWFPGVRVSIGLAKSKLGGTQGRAVDHIGFEVDGLKMLCERLEAAGVKFNVPYREVPSINASIAFFTDPWGTYIELTEGLDRIK